MKSVKPGRGPSMMSAIIGIAAALFGVFWTVMAVSGGAYIMAPFGVIFIVVAIVQVVYNFKNATGKNRYSSYDITESGEEPDPFNEMFGEKERSADNEAKVESRFCPYCGVSLNEDYKYCNICGKKLP